MRTMRGSARGPAFFCLAVAALAVSGCREAEAARKGNVETTKVEAPAASGPSVTAANPVEAGRYLITVAGCNDCHTEQYMERNGAVPETEWLMGSVVGFKGPWGTTYPANLRRTVASMTEDAWVEMLGTRTTMPPMPWMSVEHMTETDRRAIYRYIRTLGDAGPAVPQALPPGQEPAGPWMDFSVHNLPDASPAS